MSLWDWLFHRRKREEELDEEVQSHLRMAVQERMEQGETAEQARDSAVREFGNVTLVKEVTRDVWGLRWLETLLQDLRYGARQLRRNPGFTAVAVLTLALGIGANTTIFSVTNALLFRAPAGIERPDRLVLLFRRFARNRVEMNVSYPNFRDWRDQNRAFSGLAAHKTIWLGLSAEGESGRVQGAMVSGNYFDVLGVRPALGRTFLPEEDRIPGAYPVAVVSYGLWNRRFGSDPGLVGRKIRISGHAFTVIGVAPRGFKGTVVGESPEIWVPMMMAAQVAPPNWQGWMGKRNWSMVQVIGRVKPGVSLEQAQANMDTVARQLEQAYPRENRGLGIVLLPKITLYPWERAKVVEFGALLTAVVGLVLLIACANVANLLLARAATRQKEMAVRLTIGASRARLIFQLLTESMLLALMGGTLGRLLTNWGADILSKVAVRSTFLPGGDFSPDGRVLSFTVLLSILTGLAFGSAPAWQACSVDPSPALKEEARTLGSPRSRLQGVLVIAQIAASLVLLTGAGLLLRTLKNYLAVNPGFEMKNILDVSLDLDLAGYSETQGRSFCQRLVGGVRALPGVESASLADGAPIAGGTNETTVLDYGQGRILGESDLRVKLVAVTPGYFRTLGIRLVAGRDFAEEDTAQAPRVAVINETMAQRLWPGENAFGKRFATSQSGGPYFQVVGVAKDMRVEALGEAPGLAMFVPFAQEYQAGMTLLVRTATDPMALLPAIRREVQSQDKNLPVFDVTTLREAVGTTLNQQKLYATLIGSFALVALVLAAIGIYGVISYSVARRTHEIGVRMALGAERSDVLRLVVGHGMVLTLVGMAIGLAGAFGATRVLSTLLFGVRSTDLVTFAGVSTLLAAVALLAICIPARRATKVDPMVALRYE
ncbi:MAG: ADOP family duplicated permease [Terriglobia bacterium]